MSVGGVVAVGGAGVSVSNGVTVVAGGRRVGVAVSGGLVAGIGVMVAGTGGEISAAGLQANNMDITKIIAMSDLMACMSISKFLQNIEPEIQLHFSSVTGYIVSLSYARNL